MKKTLLLAAVMPCAAFAQVPMGTNYGPSFITIILSILIMVGLFLLFREVLCWYWKVNKMVQNQEEIIRLLKIIASKKHEENYKESDSRSQFE